MSIGLATGEGLARQHRQVVAAVAVSVLVHVVAITAAWAMRGQDELLVPSKRNVTEVRLVQLGDNRPKDLLPNVKSRLPDPKVKTIQDCVSG